MSISIPTEFLEVRIHDAGCSPALLAVCAGYEAGEWRSIGLAKHMFSWLPDFVLPLSDLRDAGSGEWVTMLRRAAAAIYKSEKFKNRGEFGELLLHIVIRQVFGSMPAISKIRYKSAANDTVKGFDAVHVVGEPGSLELWLGEAKFYADFTRAARDVSEELVAHTRREFLREEFLLLRGKIDPALPHAQELERLFDENLSLDEVFRRAVIPVLLTYDSDCLAGHAVCDAAFLAAFEEEIRAHWEYFAGRLPMLNATVQLILLPLCTKERLIAALDKGLKAWQSI